MMLFGLRDIYDATLYPTLSMPPMPLAVKTTAKVKKSGEGEPRRRSVKSAVNPPTKHPCVKNDQSRLTKSLLGKNVMKPPQGSRKSVIEPC